MSPNAEELRKRSVTPDYSRDGGTVLTQQRAEVVLVSTTARFAPGEEWVWIKASIKNIEKAGCLVLQIRDKDDALVYTERLSQAQVWSLPTGVAPPGDAAPSKYDDAEDASVTKDRAALPWAHPGGSPYKITVLISGTKKAAHNSVHGSPKLTASVPLEGRGDGFSASSARPDADTTKVELDALALERVAWPTLYEASTGASATDVPADGDALVKWVQHRLNHLGWFAGPIDGNPDSPDLKRAIIRYRQTHPVLHSKAFKASADGSGVFVLDSTAPPSGAIDPALTAELEDGQLERALTDTPGVFTGADGEGKIYVDAERFCQDAVVEFASDATSATRSIKDEKEDAWLSKPRIPLRAKVMVKDSGGVGVWSPGASAAMTVTWSWADAAAATDGLPAAPGATKTYVEKAVADAGEAVASDYHNARALVGGQIAGNRAADKAVVFEQLGDCELTAAEAGEAWGATTVGDLVFFCPSCIGGDNYTLTAKVGGTSESTGKMTVWRRMHVAAHIGWGAAPTDAWSDVATEYAHAFLELVEPPVKDTMASKADATLKAEFKRTLEAVGVDPSESDLADGAWDPRDHSTIAVTGTTPQEMADRLIAILNGGDAAYDGWVASNTVTVDMAGRYNDALQLVQRQWGRGDDASLGAVGRDKNLILGQAHYERELKRIIGATAVPVPDGYMVGNFLREHKWKKEPGAKVVRFRAMGVRALDVWAGDQAALDKAQQNIINDRVSAAVTATRQVVHLGLDRLLGPGVVVLEHKPHEPVAGFLSQSSPNMMMGGGKVVINRACFGPYKEEHLFSHELAHAVFLKHFKNAGGYVSFDHDQSDENCVMSYIHEDGKQGDFLPGTGAHYAPTQFEPHFCGKCNLKLRGWNIRAKRSDTTDVLPRASTPVLHPVPRVEFVRQPVEIASPTLLEAASESLLRDLLPLHPDVSQLWLNGNKPSRPGSLGIFANPSVSPSKTGHVVDWSYLEGVGFPLGEHIGTPDLASPQHAIDEWDQSLNLWAMIAARSVDAGVQFNVCCPMFGFTDFIHETCHLFQKWTTDQVFYEGPTEIFAAILSERIQRQLKQSGHGDVAHRFKYEFNPSYMETGLVAIDQWLPQLGMAEFGNLYVVEDQTAWHGLYEGPGRAAQKDKLQVSVARNDLMDRSIYKADKRSDTEDIHSTALRPDLLEVIDNANAHADGLGDDLQNALKSFMAAVHDTSGLTAKKKTELGKVSGLEQTYLAAKLHRRQNKQVAYVRQLREAEFMSADASRQGLPLLGGGTGTADDVARTLKDALVPLLGEYNETEGEIEALLA